jgi:hypothetical protein
VKVRHTRILAGLAPAGSAADKLLDVLKNLDAAH